MDLDRTPALYPELISVGFGRLLLERLSSRRSLPANLFIDGGPEAGRVEQGVRQASLWRANDTRLFCGSFRERGVELAELSTSAFEDVVRAVDGWCIEQGPPAAVSASVPGFTERPLSAAYMAGPAAYVEAAWTQLRSQVSAEPAAWGTRALVEAAWQRPELRQLLPVKSHASLGFSRCTGYPFTRDLPWAVPFGDSFRVKDARGRVQGEGSAEEVVARLVELLPATIDPAVHGTAHMFNTT